MKPGPTTLYIPWAQAYHSRKRGMQIHKMKMKGPRARQHSPQKTKLPKNGPSSWTAKKEEEKEVEKERERLCFDGSLPHYFYSLLSVSPMSFGYLQGGSDIERERERERVVVMMNGWMRMIWERREGVITRVKIKEEKKGNVKKDKELVQVDPTSCLLTSRNDHDPMHPS